MMLDPPSRPFHADRGQPVAAAPTRARPRRGMDDESVDARTRGRHVVEKGALSQWQLIRLRFSKHKLAVASMFVLIVLYTMALFAEFLAPTTKNERNYDYMWCPPQMPRFSFSEGFHVKGMVNKTNPVTLETYYVKRDDVVVPLGFLVKGEPYRFWGLFEWDRHFFGVDHERFEAPPDGEVQPVWYFLGSDRYGHDLFSRLIYGSRISLSIGLISIGMTFFLWHRILDTP